jgi:TrmH family RNA methyltransferase
MRKLHRASERKLQQQTLIEGTHLLEAACMAGRSLLTLCHTQDWQQRYPDLWHQARQQAQRVELVSPEILRAIATTVEPDGVVATLARTAMLPPAFTQLGLILETIQDPGNLGTMIRTVAAVGAEGLLLSSDSVDLDHPKVLRASAGVWFRVPIAVSHDLPAAIKHYQQQGLQIVATAPTATQTYWQLDFRQPSILLLGNEGAGLSSELLNLADACVAIPLEPGTESLNVAIAAALILYEAKRQQTQTTSG